MILTGCGLGETPPAAIDFQNLTSREIGIARTETGQPYEALIAASPEIFFVPANSRRSLRWVSPVETPLCELPELRYYIVEFDLPADRYIAGETSSGRMTLLDTIGPDICWDSKTPTYSFDG